MRLNLAFLLFWSICFTGPALSSQTPTSPEKDPHALKQVLQTAKNDTARCNALDALIEAEEDDLIWPRYNEELKALCEANLKTARPGGLLYRFYLRMLAVAINNKGYLANMQGNYTGALELYQKSLKMAEDLQDLKSIAVSLNNIGAIYQFQGAIEKALGYYQRSLSLQEKINDQPGIAEALNNIGYVYNEQGDILEALAYYHRALKIRDEISRQSRDPAMLHENKKGKANVLNNIGYIYQSQDNLSKAREYFNKALVLQVEIGDKNGMAGSLNNIGNVLNKQHNNPGALRYYQRSMKLVEASGNRQGLAHALNNIGSVYAEQGDLAKALPYFQRSLTIREEDADKQGTIHSLTNMASLLLRQRKVREAQLLCERALKLARELGFPGDIGFSSGILSDIYSKTGNWKGAYEMHLLFQQMTDSTNKEVNKRLAIQKGFQYAYEKKAIADSIRAAEEHHVFAARLSQQKTQRSALYIGITLIALFAGFMYNRFRLTRKQKQIIELKEKETQQQKNIIEEKHKEISDSIYYAERIQRSFLASKALLDKNLKDYFVLFKPKAVVSGDFYWAAELQNGHFAFATADSTGHGVPGAIMSILNISSLEKAVSEGFSQPAALLNETRLTIIERLKKDGSAEGGKDGMDASLICFDPENRRFSYAAANNPLLLVRNNTLIELAADKMPVGKFEKDEVSFTQHEFELRKNDVIYALTDGLPDQFGGVKGKKFMYKHLKALLIELAPEPMAVQRQRLEQAFEDWKGELEQVDDVTVVGIRIG